MAVTLLTFSGQNILPEYDAEARKGMTGFTTMPAVTLSGSNLIHLTECYGMIAGYQFQITAMDVTVSLPSSGTVSGALYLHLDTTNAQTPLEVIASPAPTYQYGNGVYDMEIATFTATPSGVDALTVTAPAAVSEMLLRRAAAYDEGDVVICPSVQTGYAFTCVAAGTTAAVEPAGYKDGMGGQIVDGTAVFEARRLAPVKKSFQQTIPRQHAAQIAGSRIPAGDYMPCVAQASTAIVSFTSTQTQTVSLTLMPSGAYELVKQEFTVEPGNVWLTLSGAFCPPYEETSTELRFGSNILCDDDGVRVQIISVKL